MKDNSIINDLFNITNKSLFIGYKRILILNHFRFYFYSYFNNYECYCLMNIKTKLLYISMMRNLDEFVYQHEISVQLDDQKTLKIMQYIKEFKFNDYHA